MFASSISKLFPKCKVKVTRLVGSNFEVHIEGGSINVHVDIGRWSKKCSYLSTLGRWVVKNGLNLVRVVCE